MHSFHSLSPFFYLLAPMRFMQFIWPSTTHSVGKDDAHHYGDSVGHRHAGSMTMNSLGQTGLDHPRHLPNRKRLATFVIQFGPNKGGGGADDVHERIPPLTSWTTLLLSWYGF